MLIAGNVYDQKAMFLTRYIRKPLLAVRLALSLRLTPDSSLPAGAAQTCLERRHLGWHARRLRL